MQVQAHAPEVLVNIVMTLPIPRSRVATSADRHRAITMEGAVPEIQEGIQEGSEGSQESLCTTILRDWIWTLC